MLENDMLSFCFGKNRTVLCFQFLADSICFVIPNGGEEDTVYKGVRVLKMDSSVQNRKCSAGDLLRIQFKITFPPASL